MRSYRATLAQLGGVAVAAFLNHDVELVDRVVFPVGDEGRQVVWGGRVLCQGVIDIDFPLFRFEPGHLADAFAAGGRAAHIPDQYAGRLRRIGSLIGKHKPFKPFAVSNRLTGMGSPSAMAEAQIPWSPSRA